MYKFILGLFVLCILQACSKNSTPNPNLEVRTIWTNKSYCAFTDIIKFHDRWFCVFREGVSHLSANGFIRVLVSDDSNEWKSHSVLKVSNADLRDPKLMIGLNDQLIIYACLKQITIENVMWELNETSDTWGTLLKSDVSNDWLWRIRKNNNNLYSLGYQITSRSPLFSALSLYTSNRSVFPKFKVLKKDIANDGCPTESSILFLDDKTMIVISRRDCGDQMTMLGTSKFPYDSIKWDNLNIVLQSPNMINVGNDIYVAGRIYNPDDRTALFKLNFTDRKLIKLADLPSKLDTGYPGMYYQDGKLWISFYSADSYTATNEERNIYLCVYKL